MQHCGMQEALFLFWCLREGGLLLRACVLLCGCVVVPGGCSSLVAFNASHNALTALPDSVTRLAKLQVLAVDTNK